MKLSCHANDVRHLVGRRKMANGIISMSLRTLTTKGSDGATALNSRHDSDFPRRSYPPTFLLFRRTHYQCKSQGPPLSLTFCRANPRKSVWIRTACKVQSQAKSRHLSRGHGFLILGFPPLGCESPLSLPTFLRFHLDVGREHSHNFSRLDARPFFSRLADEL